MHFGTSLLHSSLVLIYPVPLGAVRIHSMMAMAAE